MLQSYLLSYPRCGASWTRYLTEIISGYQTVCDINNYSIIHANSNILYNIKPKWVLSKTHDHWKVVDYNYGLILILRDYHECIVKHCSHLSGFNFQEVALERTRQKTSYIENLYKFDEWPGRKILIYYEDLMQQPRKTVFDLTIFLGSLPDHLDRFEDFFDRYTEHKNNSIKIYEKTTCKSDTRGDTVSFHINKLDYADQKLWDQLIHEKHPEIYKRYLQCYRVPV